MFFAFITVVITVHAFVFYNLYVVNGTALMSATTTDNIADAIRTQGGVYMFARFVPVWLVVAVEFLCAYALEVIIGQPLSFRLASRMFDPMTTSPTLFETTIITSTVFFMCPSMSLLASLFYFPYAEGLTLAKFLATWFRTVCYNLPFAFFSQLLFIQPLVRMLYRLAFPVAKEK
ncbi:MAG: hypothetical protein IJ761_04455 [Bacteroidales bacterium]|nr:hypothetical protein [Bacteroidales bacterium]